LKTALSFGADNSKNRGFFAASFFAVNDSSAKLTHFLPRLFGPMVFANPARYIKMPTAKMLFGSDALKVVGSVVSLVTVNVMDLFNWIKIIQPASRNNSMHKTLAAQHKVSLCVNVRNVGVQISKNFPAARNSVKMVKHTVFNTVHRKANHVVPS